MDLSARTGEKALNRAVMTNPEEIATKMEAEKDTAADAEHADLLMTEALRTAMNTSDMREEKLRAIRQRIADGTYEVDAASIAQGLLRELPGLFRF